MLLDLILAGFDLVDLAGAELELEPERDLERRWFPDFDLEDLAGAELEPLEDELEE